MTQHTHSPETGEVVSLPDLGDEYIAITRARDEAAAELARLEGLLADAFRQIHGSIEPDGVLRTARGDAIVRIPGRPGRRTVDAGVASEHRERLLAMDLGEEVKEYRPPTLAQVNACRAELAAAGVPLDSLIRQGNPGPDTLKIVRQETQPMKRRRAPNG